jgi:hypothetical protein
MPSFKEPSFQERVNLANKTRQNALDKLRAKPPVDEAVLAERRAAHDARLQAQAKARQEKLAARELEKAEKARAAEAERLVAAPAPAMTEAEKKAARDARYAARKKRSAAR